ncbi:MAG: hypothetical protein HYY15_01645 [Candidatus Omnitrophica bacterium]|nr:hypothetical protein [Candidatus Omnitrophota bacterium]
MTSKHTTFSGTVLGLILFCLPIGALAEEYDLTTPGSSSATAAEEASSTLAPTDPLSLEDAAASPADPVVVEYQTLRSEGEALQLCEAFLDRIQAGQYEEAFHILRPFFPVSDARFAKLSEETRRQHGLAELQFGASVGRTLLSSDTVRDSLLRFRFLEKFEWDVMSWDFVLYRPAQGWMLHGIGFDDDVQALFE